MSSGRRKTRGIRIAIRRGTVHAAVRDWFPRRAATRRGIPFKPLVQAATWQVADGRIGIVVANCADLGESPRVELGGQGNKIMALNVDGQQSERSIQLPSVIDIDMPPRSLVLIEVK